MEGDWIVYVLFLEENKFYIGFTSKNRLDTRLNEHYTGEGSEWTKIYKPILEAKPIIYFVASEIQAKRLELTTTLDYIENYGISNVRGHIFTSIKLKDSSISLIQKIIIHDADLCFQCNNSGHYFSDCPYKYNNK